MPTYDAYGRDVRELGTCARCGSPIKYIFVHEGKTYGSSCIEAVTGIGKDYQVFKGQEFDLEASKQRKAEAEAKRQERIAQGKADAERRARNQAHNHKVYEDLIDTLRFASNRAWDFADSVANQIVEATGNTELYKGILSPRQFEIVVEIWSKTEGGRRGSKAYKKAEREFFVKFAPDLLDEWID